MTVSLDVLAADPWAHIAVCADVQVDAPEHWTMIQAVVRGALGSDAAYAAWSSAVIALVGPFASSVTAGERMMDRGDAAEVAEWVSEELGGEHRLAYDSGLLWRCVDGVWSEVQEAEVVSAIRRLAGTSIYAGENEQTGETKTRTLKVNSTRQAIEMVRAIPYDHGQYTGFFDDAPRGVAFGATFMRATVEDGDVYEVELAAHHRARARFDFDFDESATCPRFEAYLASVWGETDAAGLLQEWVGAALFGLATRYHRALMLHGAPGSGKSTLIQIVEGMFPEGTVCNIGPADFADDDKLGMLIGKRLNTLTEATQAAIRSQDRVKAIVCGEPQTVVRKWEKAARFTPDCAHLFAVNEWPSVPGAHASYWDRWVALSMPNRVRGTDAEVKDLARLILAEELPGLVAWAVAGARRVLEQDGFSPCVHSAGVVSEWKGEADSIGVWMETCVEEVNDASEYQAAALFERFDRWAVKNRFGTMSSKTFGQRLRERGVNKRRSSAGYMYQITLTAEGGLA